jgi:hypothetical protein
MEAGFVTAFALCEADCVTHGRRQEACLALIDEVERFELLVEQGAGGTGGLL